MAIPMDIAEICKTFSLDQNLITAMIEHESRWESYKPRFESGWRYFYFAREFAEKLGITAETEMALQQMSWGPMQIMGSVARELGFKDDIPTLCEPHLGIEYGCRKMRQLLDRWPTETDAISAYNQGSPKKTPGGLYLNAKGYVDPICARLREIRERK